jgi:hypothetical protein
MNHMMTPPPFPTDGDTLERLEHACHTRLAHWPDGEQVLIDGDFTLDDLLDNLSQDHPGMRYSETDVILALIERVCELQQVVSLDR